PAKPLKGASSLGRDDGQEDWKFAVQNPYAPMVDIKSWRGLYTATTVRRRLGAMAHLRSSSPFRGFSSGNLLEERGFEALRSSGRRRWRFRRQRLLFEIVDRKKEKRGRRSPCGLFLASESSCGKSNETSAVLRFDSSSFVRSRA